MRLPHLTHTALRLRDRQHHVEPGPWTGPIAVEERYEGEQKLSRYVPKLPELDERVLILYHSSLKRAWKQQRKQPEINKTMSSLSRYGHEAIYAATLIQKIVRGVAAREEWRAFYCLRNQSAAARIQFAFRRVLVCRRVLARLTKKRSDRATQIQAWFRGYRCRDLLLLQYIRVMNQRIANFQKYIRGRRLWRIVMAMLHRRRCDVATEIQRCHRGWKGRQRAVAIRFEQNRYVRALIRESKIHAQCARCSGCQLDSCTEDSLFACFMARYVGLHDFKGAKTLCEDGLRLFPSSAKFVFFYAVLLQAICEEIETFMVFLKRAKEIGITNEQLSECETHFFLPAHLLRPDDAQTFLDLAILCQCCGQLPRAEANYAKALDQLPQEYAIPGYLHRVNMVDRLLLNYHRFCSIFNFRQVNVLLKEVFTAKKGKKVRLMVSKLNHYTAITPMDSPTTCRINALYLTDDEIYYQDIAGLNVKPSVLGQFSEGRSKLRLTRTSAEFLLNTLVFTVMLIPYILKLRQQHRSGMISSRAALDVQRVYRGFRLRAEIRRERFLHDIRQKQADEMYHRLHKSYVLRELRRTSAIAIQKIYKGCALRKLLQLWKTKAGQIQRVFRGYRGRLRAAAFRDGTCTFYMAQRVYQRGVNISGHRVMLVIDKCGFSFRLDGYDLASCVAYNGFLSHSSSMNLLCYLNWTYAETLCGREFTRKGDKITIRSVSSVNRLTAECFVICVGGTLAEFTVPLADCIQAINLRNFSAGAKETPLLAMPMTVDDTARFVQAIAGRVILVPALRMATQDLKAKASAGFTISVQPPPEMHFMFQRKPSVRSKNSHTNTSSSSVLQFVYPVIDGLRGVSIGTKQFRKKCTRHAVQFTRCRCMLPIISTSAHVEAISRALALSSTTSGSQHHVQ
ncbi:uncharacterized protein PITG_05643 [Phytophthora infestans T30-4]|uniref:Uncharacterized protein n=1 Tax=Phytophthora infestans (strain T30-4) TaxID=403677 RepID=D0N3B8_PHYIT|nr:uncharacterized protein PITG_05643 [Phytophthora infestans T30-4]EEY69410.1 hypothetical protein PITG_05643 [Phytophthora infestans T30-4]|eukprot:XP_002999264.1 hypothetical protein PITG_05643 [Phytophthora infestans T30-4]